MRKEYQEEKNTKVKADEKRLLKMVYKNYISKDDMDGKIVIKEQVDINPHIQHNKILQSK